MVARSAGKFAGGFLTSPFGLGLLGVGALAVGLFIFRDKITSFYQNSFNAIPEIKLPDIVLPDIKFPEIKFPEFNFPHVP